MDWGEGLKGESWCGGGAVPCRLKRWHKGKGAHSADRGLCDMWRGGAPWGLRYVPLERW